MAGSGSIGTVTVDVEADASDVPGQVEKQTTGKMAGAGRKIGDALGGALTTSAKLAGTAVAGILGTSLVKGFARLESIDTATAKLKGLGNSAEDIAGIMDAATKAVKGTAFGLGDAASAAAQFTAAGIPIDQMQRSLTILGSAAAVAGTSMGDMTTIFGKVAATGKLNGEVLQQLSERGIPVLSLLAEHYGITAEAAQKMVSDGQVDFATFQDVMEGALGPAAQAMGLSFSGMLSNVGAALGRFGAAAQKPAFEALKVLFPPIISAVDQLTSVVGPLATALGERLAPMVQALADALSNFDLSGIAGNTTGFVDALAPLTPVLLGLAGALGPLLSGLPVVGGLFSGLTGPVGLAAGALIALTAFKPETLINGFDSLASSIPGVIDKIVGAVTTLVPQMVARIAANIPVFVNGILQLITAVIPAITTAIPMIVNAVLTLIPQIITSLLGAVPQILSAGLAMFMGLVQAIVTIVPQVITALIGALPQILSSIVSMLPAILDAALQTFLGIVLAVVAAIPEIVTALADLLPELIITLVDMIPGLIDTAIDLFLALVQGLAQALPQIITALVGILPRLITALVGMIPRLIEAAIKLFLAIVQAIPKAIPAIVQAVVAMAPALVNAVISMVPALIGAAGQLIGGLVKGIVNGAGQVISALVGVAKNAVNAFKSFLGIASPSRLMEGFGEDTVDGYVNAVEAGQSAVDKAFMDMIKPLEANMALTSGTPTIGPTAGAGGAGVAGATDNSRVVNVEKGAIEIAGPDPYKVSLLTLNRLSETVGVLTP
jgi:tape measure domain-containing protein